MFGAAKLRIAAAAAGLGITRRDLRLMGHKRCCADARGLLRIQYRSRRARMDAGNRGARSKLVTTIVGLTLSVAMTDCAGASESDQGASTSLPSKGNKTNGCGNGRSADS